MGASSDDDFVADINVTPFVDVMLVLLIIFMVTAPMMTEGLDVALPKVESSEVLPTEDDHLILTIKADGALFLDEYETGPGRSARCAGRPGQGTGPAAFRAR